MTIAPEQVQVGQLIDGLRLVAVYGGLTERDRTKLESDLRLVERSADVLAVEAVRQYWAGRYPELLS